MSVEARVEEWLRKMGYDGEIPFGLSKICNPSTAFIWEQLITNVKPRQEVELKRKNIIVDRLSKKPLEQQDQFSYPIKEIEIYMKKRKLEKHIEHLEKNLEEKEEKIDELLKSNNMTYITIDNIKAKIKENQERTFLLGKKSKLLKEDIQQAQESLTLARNLTPVEMDVNANGEEITKTLQKCAEKLQKLSEEVPLPKTYKHRSLSASVMKGKQTPKYSSKVSTFSRYLNQSTLVDIAPSTIKNKENFSQHPTISRCLKFTDDVDGNKKKKPEKTRKRESLGLLPDGCFNISDDLDAFLLSSDNSVLQPLSDSVFDPPENTNNDLIETLSKDKSVQDLLKNLLHENNRYLILCKCKNIFEQLLGEIRTPIMECNKLIRSDRGINQSDLTQLYLIHVKGELEKEKYRIVSKKLSETVKRKKEEILFQLSNRSRNKDEIKKILELQIEDAYITGANNFLQKEINASKKLENDIEQQAISVKIKQAQEEIIYKNDCIQNLVSTTYKVLGNIRNNRNETSLCVKKLTPFIHDLRWANPMTEDSNFQEVETFKKFPIEYNRRFKYNQSQIFYNSVSDTKIPSYLKTDSDDLEIVSNLLSEPFTSAENVIFEVLRAKIVSNQLQEIGARVDFGTVDYNAYTPEELCKREEYIDSMVNKLSSIINSSSVREILSSPSDMKEIADLWLQMPFKNFISEKRQVDGHGYRFYEKMLEEFRSS